MMAVDIKAEDIAQDISHSEGIKVEPDNSLSICDDIKCEIEIFKNQLKVETEEVVAELQNQQAPYMRLPPPAKLSDKSRYQCKVCDKRFRYRADWLNHKRYHPDPPPEFNCIVCNEIFHNKEDYKAHRMTHKKPYMLLPKWTCEVCNKLYSIRTDRKTHMHLHSCEICKDNDHCEVYLQMRPYKCDYCKKSYFKKKHLSDHMVVHTNWRSYSCDKCMKIFSFKCHLKTHTCTSIKKCSECNKVFDTHAELRYHKYIHSNKFYGCKICNTFYKKEANFNTHICIPCERKDLNCEICKKNYTDEDSLAVHMQSHTEADGDSCNNETNREQEYSQDIKHPQHKSRKREEYPMYYCGICNKRYIRKCSLRKHVQMHVTGTTNKFLCTICKMCFTSKKSLCSHVQLHSDERPYTCVVCDISFQDEVSFEKHMSSHIGNKPFRCFLCDRMFRMKVNLDSHLEAHLILMKTKELE